MKKWYSVLPMVVFLVFLAVMTALLLFGPKGDFSVNEKRVLAQAPDLSPSAILKGETQKELAEKAVQAGRKGGEEHV